LTDEELTYLKATFGVDLRDPEVIAAHVGLERARKQLDFVEREMLASCAFCNRSSAVAGALAKSSQGVCICKACAESCIQAIEGDDAPEGPMNP
jgi:ClpX C4-type zinc finger